VTKLARIFNLDTKKISAKIENDILEEISIASYVSSPKFDFNYEASEELEEEEGKEDIFVREETEKIGVPKRNLGGNIFKMVQNKIKGIGKMIAISQPENRDKYMALPKLDEENTYSSQALAQLWGIFKYIFNKSDKVKTVLFVYNSHSFIL